jgi:GGDEF domain-containing protein
LLLGADSVVSCFFKALHFAANMNNGAMDVAEIILWSCMLGGLITLSCGAVGEILSDNNIGAWRALAYLVVLGGSVVMGSGLPLALFPDFSPQALLSVQAIVGPLSGALVLWYLGVWLGVAMVDRVLHIIITWGTFTLLGVAILQGLIALGVVSTGDLNPLWISAAVCTAGVIFALQASIRAYMLGDDLARWMAVACGLLAVMVVGFHTNALRPGAVNLAGKALIALCTLIHFLMGIRLSMRRNAANSKRKRRASDIAGFDRATGLPTGSVLLSKVDDALWRAERAEAGCSVVALHLRNLYSIGETAGHAIDQQILAAVAARIRRAVGFRYLVGLYHPRCFVVVIAHTSQRIEVDRMVFRLKAMLSTPILLSDAQNTAHHFLPAFGVGVSRWVPGHASAQQILDDTEQRALAQIPPEPPADPASTGASALTAAAPLV